MKLSNIFAIFLIILTVIIFFNKLIFNNEIFITGDYLRSDTLNQNLPFKFEYFHNLKIGHLPLWTDKIFSGYPLLAEGQVGVFYPLNIIFFKLFNFTYAYNLVIVGNFIIAALGMYWFLKYLGIKTISAGFSSLIFSLSSPFVLHITHQNIISAVVWLPLIFLFNRMFFDCRNIRYFILSIFCFSASLLAGSSQITFYIFIALTIYLIIFRKFLKYSISKILFYLFLELFFSFILCSVQLFPLLELINSSTRVSGLGNLALNSLPYHFRNILTLIYPYIFGDPGLGTYPHFGGSWGMFWENTLYIGIIPLILSVSTLLMTKIKKDVLKYWWFALIIVLLSLGKYSPLFFVYYLPIFNYFRVASRFLFIESFTLSIIMAFALDYLIKYIKTKSIKYMIIPTIIGISIFDLFLFGYDYNPTEKIDKVLAKPEIINFLSNSIDDRSRIFVLGADIIYDSINKNGWRNNNHANLNHANSLDADSNMLWDIQNLDGYAGLYLTNFQNYKNLIYSGINYKNDQINIENSSLKLLGVSSVKYLVSPFDLNNKNLIFIDEFGTHIKYKLYRNKLYLQRGAFFVSITNNFSKFLQSDIGKVLFLDSVGIGNTSMVNKLESSSDDSVTLKEDDISRIVFETNTPLQKWFMLSDSYYPGWKAYIDGVETPIMLANVMFRAVQIPAGSHVLSFVYEPVTYYYGRILSICIFITLTFFWIFYELRRKI